MPFIGIFNVGSFAIILVSILKVSSLVALSHFMWMQYTCCH